MSWKRSKFATSFLSLFVEPAPARPSAIRVQEVRQAMLDCFQGVPPGPDQARLWGRVLYAPDIQALWYLRSDMMTLLAHPLGETEARTRVANVTTLFVGLLPSAQKARVTRPPPRR
jgi:hypothetical protein